MTEIIQIGPSAAATQVISAGDGHTLINNNGPSTVFFGDTNAIRATDAVGVIPIASGGYFTVDGQSDLFACIVPGATSQLLLLSGGLNFFVPANLIALGGIKVFVQPLAPTQPPAIPVNSLWLNTTAGALESWNGAAWIVEAFTGTQLLTAGTIATNLLIANFFSGYEIDGAIFRAVNASGATIMTINKTNGTWILYKDTGSATQGMVTASGNNSLATVTDEFNNEILPGLTAYGGMTTNWSAVNITGANTNGALSYYTSTAATQTNFTVQTQLGFATGAATTITNSGFGFGFGSNDQVSIGAGEGPFILNEGWHTITLPSTGGFTGTIRVKKLPWNMIALDVAIQWTNTTNASFTGGSLPDATYYPTSARWFPIAHGGAQTTDNDAVIQIPTSGAITITTNASSGGSGTAAQSGITVTYPTN